MNSAAKWLGAILIGACATCCLAGAAATDVDVIDAEYATACGPIACYAAARALNFPVKLGDMARRCDWEPEKYTSLATMAKALSEVDGLTCTACRLSPSTLVQYLSSPDCCAILPVRKSGQNVDHALVALGAKDGRVVLFDYPELTMVARLDDLCDRWDGEALVVTRASVGKVRWWIAVASGGMCCIVLCGLCIRVLRNRKRKMAKRQLT